MLQDFIALEQIYSSAECTQFYDELLHRYDESLVNAAISSGYVLRRQICIGPDCGRCLCWLSETGRVAAKTII